MYGSNFVASSNLRCRFRADVVVGTYATATAVVCITPAHNTEAVSVDISNNNQDYTATGSVWYTFDPSAVISSVFPPLGPTGGSTTVTVRGSEFLSTAWCKFGTAAGIAATVAGSTQLQCVAPAQAAATVALEVSVNNQDYTAHRAEFLFYGMLFRCVISGLTIDARSTCGHLHLADHRPDGRQQSRYRYRLVILEHGAACV